MGRSDGRSAVAASAYRAGEKIIRAETGDVQDYTRKSGVVWSAVLAPPDAPDWASDRAELWNKVEAKETRKNSQLSREIELALPHELTREQNEALLREWVQSELVSRGMVADVCVHDPQPGPGRNPNIHAHVMTTLRGLDSSTDDGWSKNKPRDWTDKATLEALRESWSTAQNKALAAAGVAARVDHRSLEAQRADAEARGDDLAAALLDRDPEPRLGTVATAIERRAARAGAVEPVTEKGAALAAAREARSALSRAIENVRRAVASASASVLGALGVQRGEVDQDAAALLDRILSAPPPPPPEDPPEDPDGMDDGLPSLS